MAIPYQDKLSQAARQTQMSQAISDLESEQEKLTDAVRTLITRLQPVCRSVPEQIQKNPVPQEAWAPMPESIRRQYQAICSIHADVRTILETLEV